MNKKVGAFLPTSKTYVSAIEDAEHYGISCFEVLTGSHSRTTTKNVTKTEIEEFLLKSPAYDIVAHSPNGLGLSSTGAQAKNKIKVLLNHIERAYLLGAKYFIVHPIATNESENPEAIIRNIETLVKDSYEIFGERAPMILIENMFGPNIEIYDDVSLMSLQFGLMPSEIRERVGIVWDSAHSLANGFDISDPRVLFTILDCREFIKVVHLNTSRQPLGSRVDDHSSSMFYDGRLSISSIKDIFEDLGDFLIILQRNDRRLYDKDLRFLKSLGLFEPRAPLNVKQNEESK